MVDHLWNALVIGFSSFLHAFLFPPPSQSPQLTHPGRLHGGSWLDARIASHGSVLVTRGWLVTVEIPGYPSLPSSIQHDAVVNSEYKPDEADFLAACVAGLFAVELSVISVVGGSVFSLHAGSKRNKSIRKLNQVLRLP